MRGPTSSLANGRCALNESVLCRRVAAQLDRAALFLGVCDHSFAIIGMWVEKGEHWRLATIILEKLAEERCVPASLFYDIACRWGPHFRKWVGLRRRLPDDAAAAALQIMTPVPPFHANMHNAACRAANSLQCADFPGWIHPIGEPTEQRWPLLGTGVRFKFMSKHGATVYVEANLVFQNLRLDESLAVTLVARVTRQRQLCVLLRNELALFPIVANVPAEVWRLV